MMSRLRHTPWVSLPSYIQSHAYELCRGGRSIRTLGHMSTVSGARCRPHSIGRCLWHSTTNVGRGAGVLVSNSRHVRSGRVMLPNPAFERTRIQRGRYAINVFGMRASSRAPFNATLGEPHLALVCFVHNVLKEVRYD
jgi:hypothetical protein